MAALASSACAPSPTASSPANCHRPSGPRACRSGTARLPASEAKLLGQRIMIGIDGTRPSSALLARVRAGRVGGIVLFTGNVASRPQVAALTGALQRAARQGANPPLLIAIDQEGGEVKRIADAPPGLSPPQLVASGSAQVAGREGRATGAYLKASGINMNLAPVVDVPTFPGAFIAQEGRAFSSDAATVATYSTAFALGQQAAGVAATAKHFPGLGSAAVNTDQQAAELRPTSTQLDGALTPYRALIADGIDAILLSKAGFPAYDASGAPTDMSRPTIDGLLRGRLGYQGVTVTDGLESITDGLLAARAGADILLFPSRPLDVLPKLESDLASGRINRADADASYERILALKQRVAVR